MANEFKQTNKQDKRKPQQKKNHSVYKCLTFKLLSRNTLLITEKFKLVKPSVKKNVDSTSPQKS